MQQLNPSPAFLRSSESVAHQQLGQIAQQLPCHLLLITYYQALSTMSASPTGNERPNLIQYGISNTRADHLTTNSVHGDSNTNVGNVSNSYNNTINVGKDEECLRIHQWLSPLEPNKRHQDVRNRRFDGVGEWVLQRSEFESWRKSRGGLSNRTLLCYGGQGVGKTCVR